MFNMLFDNNEAILFRLLTSFFGHDQVIPQMSVHAACGGQLPKSISKDILQWSKKAKCLFTVVNEDDIPKLVVELAVDNKDSIDIHEMDKQMQAKALLDRVGVPYIAISKNEFSFITDPKGQDNLYFFLKDKFYSADNNDGV